MENALSRKKAFIFLEKYKNFFILSIVVLLISTATSIILIFFLLEKNNYVIIGGSKNALSSLGLMDTDLEVVKKNIEDKREYLVVRMRKNDVYLVIARGDTAHNKLILQVPFGFNTKQTTDSKLETLNFDPSILITFTLNAELKKAAMKLGVESHINENRMIRAKHTVSTFDTGVFAKEETENAFKLANQYFNTSLVTNAYRKFGNNYERAINECFQNLKMLSAYIEVEQRNNLYFCSNFNKFVLKNIFIDGNQQRYLDDYLKKLHEMAIRKAPKLLFLSSSLPLNEILNISTTFAAKLPAQRNWDSSNYPAYYKAPAKADDHRCKIMGHQIPIPQFATSILLRFHPQSFESSQLPVFRFLHSLNFLTGSPSLVRYFKMSNFQFDFESQFFFDPLFRAGEVINYPLVTDAEFVEKPLFVLKLNIFIQQYFLLVEKYKEQFIALYQQQAQILKMNFTDSINKQFDTDAKVAENFLYSRDIENLFDGTTLLRDLSEEKFLEGLRGLSTSKSCSIYYTLHHDHNSYSTKAKQDIIDEWVSDAEKNFLQLISDFNATQEVEKTSEKKSQENLVMRINWSIKPHESFTQSFSLKIQQMFSFWLEDQIKIAGILPNFKLNVTMRKKEEVVIEISGKYEAIVCEAFDYVKKVYEKLDIRESERENIYMYHDILIGRKSEKLLPTLMEFSEWAVSAPDGKITYYDMCTRPLMTEDYKFDCKYLSTYLSHHQNIKFTLFDTSYNDDYQKSLSKFEDYLKTELLTKIETVQIAKFPNNVELKFLNVKVRDTTYWVLKTGMKYFIPSLYYGIRSKDAKKCSNDHAETGKYFKSVKKFLEFALGEIAVTTNQGVAVIARVANDKEVNPEADSSSSPPLLGVFIVSEIALEEIIEIVESYLDILNEVIAASESNADMFHGYDNIQKKLKDLGQQARSKNLLQPQTKSKYWDIFNSCFNYKNNQDVAVKLVVQVPFQEKAQD